MSIYIIAFIVSCILIKISDNLRRNKALYYLIRIVAISIPCVLAGMRDTSIGTDVEVYVNPLFKCAERANDFGNYLEMCWWNIWHFVYVSDFEIGFSTLVYFVTKITGSIQLVLFMIHTIIIIPIYLGLKKFKELDGKIWLSMFILYFLIYNVTLNAMRQYMGIAILFYGTACLLNEKKGKLKFFIAFLLAILFHYSSVLGIFIYIFYIIFNHNYKKNKVLRINSDFVMSINKLLIVFIIILGIIIIMNSNLITTITKLLGLNDYLVYVYGSVKFNISTIIKILPIVCIFIVNGNHFMKKYENSYLYITMFIMEIITSQYSSINIYAARIGFLFQIFSIVSLPLLCRSNPKREINQLITGGLMLYLITYWIYYFVLVGANETIPYILYWS